MKIHKFDKFNEEIGFQFSGNSDTKDESDVIRIERADDNKYSFVLVKDGKSSEAKEISLSSTQRADIEKILNKK